MKSWLSLILLILFLLLINEIFFFFFLQENVDRLKFKDFFRGPEDELPLKRVRFSDDIEDDENNQR